MGDVTTISWAERTFNPWIGCQKVGPGCDNCYAEARDARYAPKGVDVAPHWGPGASRQLTVAANWKKPHQWNRKAEREGIRLRVFCASLADVFDNAIDPSWRMELWRTIRETPHLDWMLLTKRPGNIAKMLPSWWDAPANVWLGASVVTQAEADRDIPTLLAIPAAVRWLSMEPLLERVDLSGLQPNLPPNTWLTLLDGLHWIIVGGESGVGARPMNLDWARIIRNQCAATGVAFHFKQMSQADHPRTYGDPEFFPEDLQVREFPRV